MHGNTCDYHMLSCVIHICQHMSVLGHNTHGNRYSHATMRQHLDMAYVACPHHHMVMLGHGMSGYRNTCHVALLQHGKYWNRHAHTTI